MINDIVQLLNSKVEVSRIGGLGKLAGQIVCEEGHPIYQGLVQEGIVKLIA